MLKIMFLLVTHARFCRYRVKHNFASEAISNYAPYQQENLPIKSVCQHFTNFTGCERNLTFKNAYFFIKKVASFCVLYKNFWRVPLGVLYLKKARLLAYYIQNIGAFHLAYYLSGKCV